MAYIPADKTAKVEMIYSSNGETCENVYHVLGTAEWDATSLTTLAGVFNTWENASAKPYRGSTTSLQETRCTDLSSQTGPVVTVGSIVAGTAAGTPLPNNVTLAVKSETGKRGRSFRGRIYWIGLTESQLASGSQGVLGSVNLAIVAAMNGLRVAAFPNSGAMVVASFRTNNAPRAAAVLTAITNWDTTDGTIDSQRRRLPGHNVHR